jgi:tetratricopeptide (TPR) repeat protein
MMLRRELGQTPERWQRYHLALAAAYRRWQPQVPNGNYWENPTWYACMLEETYHLLCADPDGSLPEALGRVGLACAQHPMLAAQWAQMIVQAGDDSSSERTRAWGQRLLESLRGNDGEARVACLGLLLGEAGIAGAVVPVALRARGRALHFLDRDTEAIADLSRAVRLAPGDKLPHSYRGDTYRRRHRYREALADYDRALELDPGDVWVITSRGETYAGMGRLDEALTELTHAIDLDPSSTWAIAVRANVFRRTGRLEEALADCDRLLNLDPSRAGPVLACRGITYMLAGRQEAAMADLSQPVEADSLSGFDPLFAPFAKAILASRGGLLRLFGHQEQALADLSQMIDPDADPSDAEAMAARGMIYLQMGRPEDAIADLNLAIDLDPSNPEAIANRGDAQSAMGQYEEALADLSKAIELDPSEVRGFLSRGETYRRMGRHEEALGDLSRGIERDPTDA